MILIPHVADGNALEDSEEYHSDKPAADESGHDPNGDSEDVMWKGTVVEHENGGFDRHVGKCVYELKGVQELGMCKHKCLDASRDRLPGQRRPDLLDWLRLCVVQHRIVLLLYRE